MKNKSIFLSMVLAAAALMAGGCHSVPKPKASLERGWIGGEYRNAQGRLAPKGEASAVYVKQVYTGTPAEEAGLKAGDLILAIEEHSVRTLKDFHQFVDAATPGNKVTIRLRRNGGAVELPVMIGREIYQQWHSVQFGLGFSTKLDLWPNPDFSVLPVAQYRRPKDRLELRSPEVMLARQSAKSGKGGPGSHSEEGWNAWFLVFGLDAHKQILSQEAVVMSSSGN